jgi:hypothetical protein
MLIFHLNLIKVKYNWIYEKDQTSINLDEWGISLSPLSSVGKFISCRKGFQALAWVLLAAPYLLHVTFSPLFVLVLRW